MAEEITAGPEYTILSCQVHTNTTGSRSFWLRLAFLAEIFPFYTYEVVGRTIYGAVSRYRVCM